METKEIYGSIWKHLLLGSLCILFGGAMLYCLQFDHSSWRARYVVPVAILLFLLGGIFLMVVAVWQRIAHRPYLRLTDEALEVFAGIGKGYERYPWTLIKGWAPGEVRGQTFVVLDMDHGFRPTAINPNGRAAKWTACLVGTPYTVPCSTIHYKYADLDLLLHSYWTRRNKPKA